MTSEEIRRLVLQHLSEIAPDAELAGLDPSADIRDAFDLDSMDFLRFATALHDALGVDIPEADYRQISTLEGCVGYLARATGS